MQNLEVTIKSETITLAIKRLRCNARMSPDILALNTSLEFYLDHVTGTLVASMERLIMATEPVESVLETVKVPSDWWQHFKQRWFRGWLLRRYPVRTRTIKTDVSVTHMCPHLDVPSNDQTHVRWLVYKQAAGKREMSEP